VGHLRIHDGLSLYPDTQNPDFLATAQKLADYFIAHLQPDFVPVWDFAYPSAFPRDSSAAAIAAAAMLELSSYILDPTAKSTYYNAALNIQTSLSNPALYLGDRALTDGVILHGSHEVPQNIQVDTSLVWGDYYFIQSCYRAKTVPPQVTNVAPSVLPSGQITLGWDVQPGKIRYSVKRSTTHGGPYQTIAPPPVLTTNTFTDTSVAGNTTYYYVVSAINVAGEGPNSFEVTATAPADTTPPTVSITSPANGSTVAKTVKVIATATDNAGVAGVQFQLDGANLGSEVKSAPYTVNWDTTSATVGSHTLTAVARDPSGNKQTSAPVKVSVTRHGH
jgi:hypothetical protein